MAVRKKLSAEQKKLVWRPSERESYAGYVEEGTVRINYLSRLVETVGGVYSAATMLQCDAFYVKSALRTGKCPRSFEEDAQRMLEELSVDHD